ncbi:MAG TPA: hypothetical protein VFA46_21070 [Actinomycetes bacterium]|jgi:hypothetical protein|nr:hypothetical protein [Actinomycetes bacterium]
MRTRASTLLVGSLILVAAGLFGLESFLALLPHAAPVPQALTIDAGVFFLSVVILAFVVVGAILAWRRPRNPVGWILLAEGLLWQVPLVASGYVGRALFAEPGSLPAGRLVAWVLNWVWVLPLALLPFFFLLFPSGRLRSPRWRVVAWLAPLSTLTVVARDALAPGPLKAVPSITNPLGMPVSAPLLSTIGTVSERAIGIVVLLASVVSFVLRFRAARGLERQQFKWLVYATAVLVASLTLGEVLSALGVPDGITSKFNIIPLIGLPVGVGFAVLAHGLYDIDRIINRTLVYGVLTALLGAVYAVGVVLVPQLFGRTSPLLVAGSTLVAAALFQPLHRPVQDVVDRRFNRRRYDAAKTIDAFSARLRQNIDLDTLTAELCAVVRQTMEPTHVSVWLRSPPQVAERDTAAQPSD